MKYVDILKKAEVVENDIIIINKPTKKRFGNVVRLTGDPCISFMRIDDEKRDGWEKKQIEEKKYWLNNEEKILIDVKYADNLINAIQTLLNKEL